MQHPAARPRGRDRPVRRAARQAASASRSPRPGVERRPRRPFAARTRAGRCVATAPRSPAPECRDSRRERTRTATARIRRVRRSVRRLRTRARRIPLHGRVELPRRPARVRPRPGLERDEPVLVAVPQPGLGLLRSALDRGRGATTSAPLDMSVAGRNPGRIIGSVLTAFVREHAGPPGADHRRADLGRPQRRRVPGLRRARGVDQRRAGRPARLHPLPVRRHATSIGPCSSTPPARTR